MQVERARAIWLLTAALSVIASSTPARAQPASPSAPPPGETAPDTSEAPDATDAPADMPWIEGVPYAERRRAREIFLEGNALLEDTLFSHAAAKYEQAVAIWAHPAFHYNLALARIHLDQPIAAYENMLQAVRYGPAPLGEDLHENAQSFLKLLRSQLAQIEVTCDEPGTAVALDGKPLFVGPGSRTIMTLPGGHMLMATSRGRLPDNQQIVLAPGQRSRLSLATRVPDRLVPLRRWPAWGPWTVTGIGLALVAGGGVLDWQSSAIFDGHDRQFDSLCTRSRGCEPGDTPASLDAEIDRADRRQRAARITYAAGGGVLATGAVLLYLNRERLVRRSGVIESSSATIRPTLAPRTLGVSIEGRF